jgi:anti-anti-sigma factor
MASDANKGPLGIDIEQMGDASVVHLSGEVDLNVSPTLRTELKDLAATKVPLIVIEMSNVPYIDSSGVATLVECLQRVSRYKGSLRLCNLTNRARGVFEISRLDTVFSIFDTQEEALSA